jgi:hypothetical protein
MPYDVERVNRIMNELDTEYMEELVSQNFERASYEGL